MAERKLRDRFGQEITPGPPLASTDPGNELLIMCTLCQGSVLVCGYVDELDAATFACLECRDSRPNEYVRVGEEREHRLVAARMLGRPLEPGEVVHHRNRLKWDNRPENLEILTGAEHRRLHQTNANVTDGVIADLLLAGVSSKEVARDYHVSIRRAGTVYRRLVADGEMDENKGGQPWHRGKQKARAVELADTIARARKAQGGKR